ncbi:hypothetical protein BX600DRAFT_472744 [Xylariales sp. PMI_506]|nr:hypothetical protein BX600DRAFT_472744 [Xylariales sp. PMI_506]
MAFSALFMIITSLCFCAAWCRDTDGYKSVVKTVPPLLEKLDDATESPCVTDNYSPCGSDLPNDFCCPSGTVCLSAAENTTAICCPDGADCTTIQPITCDIQLQNATLYPESSVHTTLLSYSLPECGDNTCCPFGYRCDGSLHCKRENNETQISQSTASETLSTGAQPTTASGSIGIKSTVTATPLSTNNDTMSKVETTAESPPNKAVVAFASVFGAFSLVGAFSYGWVRWRRRRARNRNISEHYPRTWQVVLSPSRSTFSPPPESQQQLYNWQSYPEREIYTSHVHDIDNIAELPATPLSVSFWNRERLSPPIRPEACYMPSWRRLSARTPAQIEDTIK